MKFKKFSLHYKRTRLWFLFVSVSLLCGIVVSFLSHPREGSPDALLVDADQLGWNNRWLQAQPIYARAEQAFALRGDHSKALYAHVSQFAVKMESADLSALIAELSNDLKTPEGADSSTRLRILEMKAKCEEEYDAATSKATFAEVERLAIRHRRWYLASRASGEQGILAFTLGDTSEAASKVKRAYAIAKYLGDPAAHIRYAEMIGMGLVQMDRPQQGLKFLDEAIDTQKKNPDVASPSVAFAGKIDALGRLGRYNEGLALANRVIHAPRKYHFYGQLQSLLSSRSQLLQMMGKDADAVQGYEEALGYASQIHAWRALSQIGGRLATAYEKLGQFKSALSAIDNAIEANQHTPAEMFLVPGNLAIKARILQKMGRLAEAENLYERGTEVLDVMLQHVPTPEVERQLLSELGDLYSGYFALLANEGRLADAFGVIENSHGRIEAQRIRFDHTEPPHAPTTDDLQAQAIVTALLRGRKNENRNGVLESIRSSPAELNAKSQNNPTSLSDLQAALRPKELLVEYVLSTPQSFALAVTDSSVKVFQLPARSVIDRDANQYRNTIVHRKTDSKSAQTLYSNLLAFTASYPQATSLIIVADGSLNLLPFAALKTPDDRFLIETKAIAASPSGTVLTLMRNRHQTELAELPYLGVAAWAGSPNPGKWVLRSGSPDASTRDLAPLPQSGKEVESIRAMLPAPATMLIGKQATKQTFQRLPLANYRVLHLALHGLTNPIYPDHSALAFAPAGNDDGRLEARDIRRLRLNADLVTLSACNTAVGPVDPTGVDSLVASFIQAGARSVVATLWEPEDHAASQFMKSFYGNVTKLDEANALRQAQLDLLRLGVQPYDWAGYEVVGNTEHPLFQDNDTH